MKRQPLPLAVIQLVNRIIGFADRNRDKELLRIAEDGVIDTAERPAYDQIVNELNDIIAAAYTAALCGGFRMKRAEKKSRPAAANNRATAYPVNETLESIFSISSECLFCKGVNRF